MTKQLENNDSNLKTLLYSLSIFQPSRIIKLEALCSSWLIKFKLFNKNDFNLKQKRNSLIAQALKIPFNGVLLKKN